MMISRNLASVSILSLLMATPALATSGPPPFNPASMGKGMAALETGGDPNNISAEAYAIDHPGGNAIGAFGVMPRTGEDAGFVTYPPGVEKTWENATFTAKANEMGVYSLDDMLYSTNGHRMQDAMAGEIAVQMWDGLSDNAVSLIGNGSIAGVPATPESVMSATWMLGAGGMNAWASGGYTVDGIGNIPNLYGPRGVMASNGCPDDSSNPQAGYQCLYDILQHRMATSEGIDVSEITDGTLEQVLVCEPEVEQMLAQSAHAKISDVVATAQDQSLGFSQLQENFGEMSCIENIFNGGLSVMFSVPDLSSIMDAAIDAVCGEVQNMTAELGNEFNSVMSEALNNSVGGSIGNDFLSTNAGISTNFNSSGGFGVGVESADVSVNLGGGSFGGSGSIGSGGSTGNQTVSTGLDGMFQ